MLSLFEPTNFTRVVAKNLFHNIAEVITVIKAR